jgi:hypothetical protein
MMGVEPSGLLPILGLGPLFLMSLPGVRNECEIKQLTANTKSILVIETKHTKS